MDSVSPVFTDAEISSEQVVALGQKEYYPIIVARIWHVIENGEGKQEGFPSSYTRFRFSDKERELIAAGADLLLGQPHHGSMMPVSVQLAMPGEYPKEGQ